MIEFRDVTKSYGHGDRKKVILGGFNGVIEKGKNIGILGHNGAGKSTLMRMIAGTEMPDSGNIVRDGLVSWPLGFSGGFHQSLSGRQNIEFISRIYGMDSREVFDFVADFADIGKSIDDPIRNLSSGMRARIAFGVSMAIDFDFYLIDEVIAVGDTAFKKRCKYVLEERNKASTLILISHSNLILKEFSEVGAVLHKGKLDFYDGINDAIKVHEANQRRG